MGSELDNELFHKFLKLLFGGVQVTSLSQIHSCDLVFEVECSKNDNSNIQLEIGIISKKFDWLSGLNFIITFSINS